MSNDYEQRRRGGEGTGDVDEAARESGTTPERVRENKARSAEKPDTTPAGKHPEYDVAEGDDGYRQDGYKETEGSTYNQSADPTQVQEGYNPAHSGVRHAHNQPGKRVDEPGRETGTAWGEDQQMGTSTDTADRRNPSQ